MIIKLKRVVIFEAIVILILIAALIISYSASIKIEKQRTNGLLSQRIYAGLIEPKSFMITNFLPLKQDIRDYITKNNLNISVYVENLRNGVFMGINEKTGFFPISLSKLPVAILIMRKIENKELSFDSMIQINDIDRKNTSGDLYKTKEQKLPVSVLMEKLLQESDNTALSALLNTLNTYDLQLMFDYYGIDINIPNQKDGVMSSLVTTPKAMSNLIASLYFSTVLESQDSEYILSLLTRTAFDIKNAANIPDEVTIAHKYGANYHDNNQFFHDCGIMYINETRILYCIMTKGMDDKKAIEAISLILNKIYNYVIDAKSRLEAHKKE